MASEDATDIAEETEIVFERSVYDFPKNKISYSTPFSEFFHFIGLPNGWEELFEKYAQELNNISDFLQSQSQEGKTIHPGFNEIFRIYYDIPPERVTVIIIGQDPYPNSSSVGYAFSVRKERKINSSMINIIKELQKEGFVVQKNSGDLSNWVKQGVFLLNTALTVEQDHVGSHADVWNKFTSASIKFLTRKKKNIPILLWGKMAQCLYSSVSCKDSHHFIMTSHPSGFSAYSGNTPFINSNCFQRANDFLAKVGNSHINFDIP